MSARTDLRKAFKTCLLEISTARSYRTNILSVSDPAIGMEQMTIFPHINLLWGTEERLAIGAGNNAFFDLKLPVQIDCFLSDQNDSVLAQDNVLADIMQYFGNNYYVKPIAGVRTAFICYYSGSVPWGTERESPNCGVSVNYDLQYRVRVDNPNIMV
jgi:hypothetical protein